MAEEPDALRPGGLAVVALVAVVGSNVGIGDDGLGVDVVVAVREGCTGSRADVYFSCLLPALHCLVPKRLLSVAAVSTCHCLAACLRARLYGIVVHVLVDWCFLYPPSCVCMRVLSGRAWLRWFGVVPTSWGWTQRRTWSPSWRG